MVRAVLNNFHQRTSEDFEDIPHPQSTLDRRQAPLSPDRFNSDTSQTLDLTLSNLETSYQLNARYFHRLFSDFLGPKDEGRAWQEDQRKMALAQQMLLDLQRKGEDPLMFEIFQERYDCIAGFMECDNTFRQSTSFFGRNALEQGGIAINLFANLMGMMASGLAVYAGSRHNLTLGLASGLANAVSQSAAQVAYRVCLQKENFNGEMAVDIAQAALDSALCCVSGYGMGLLGKRLGISELSKWEFRFAWISAEAFVDVSTEYFSGKFGALRRLAGYETEALSQWRLIPILYGLFANGLGEFLGGLTAKPLHRYSPRFHQWTARLSEQVQQQSAQAQTYMAGSSLRSSHSVPVQTPSVTACAHPQYDFENSMFMSSLQQLIDSHDIRRIKRFFQREVLESMLAAAEKPKAAPWILDYFFKVSDLLPRAIPYLEKIPFKILCDRYEQIKYSLYTNDKREGYRTRANNGSLIFLEILKSKDPKYLLTLALEGKVAFQNALFEVFRAPQSYEQIVELTEILNQLLAKKEEGNVRAKRLLETIVSYSLPNLKKLQEIDSRYSSQYTFLKYYFTLYKAGYSAAIEELLSEEHVFGLRIALKDMTCRHEIRCSDDFFHFMWIGQKFIQKIIANPDKKDLSWAQKKQLVDRCLATLFMWPDIRELSWSKKEEDSLLLLVGLQEVGISKLLEFFFEDGNKDPKDPWNLANAICQDMGVLRGYNLWRIYQVLIHPELLTPHEFKFLGNIFKNYKNSFSNFRGLILLHQILKNLPVAFLREHYKEENAVHDYTPAFLEAFRLYCEQPIYDGTDRKIHMAAEAILLELMLETEFVKSQQVWEELIWRRLRAWQN